MNTRILIVEDDPDIAALVAMQAREYANDVQVENNGSRGLLAAQRGPWDLIVLDWLLPGVDGITVCQRLRASRNSAPIMLLTARRSEVDRVQGLDAGADDYLAKPFGVAELGARMRAQLRRARQWHRSGEDDSTDSADIRCGPFTIQAAARRVLVEETPLTLTAREFNLLRHFASHPGRVFTREQLLSAVWGAGFDGFEHTVNSHINRLRAKFEPDPARPRYLVTVWGVGYRFEPT